MPFTIKNRVNGKQLMVAGIYGVPPYSDGLEVACGFLAAGIPPQPPAWDVIDNGSRPGDPPGVAVREIVLHTRPVTHLDADKLQVNNNGCKIQIWGGFAPVAENQRWRIIPIETDASGIVWNAIVCNMSGKRLNADLGTVADAAQLTRVQLWTFHDGSPVPGHEQWALVSP